MRAVSLIEPLEDRIAPASVFTYTDATGDRVVVSTTRGVFSSQQFHITSGNLTLLDISGQSGFTGANIVFTVFPVVQPGLTGSATVNVGTIDASSVSLGNVTVPGDLGIIDAGDGKSPVAIGALTVNSLGAQSSTTGVSNINGTIGVVNVAGNIEGTLFAQDYLGHGGTGNIGRLNVKGSVYGGQNSAGPGDIFFTGTLGTAVIGGGIEGGSAPYSGSIGGYGSTSGGYATFSRIGSITVNGSVPDDPNPNPLPGGVGTSILGGSGAESGEIAAVYVGSVFVAGDIHGGTGVASGGIQGGLALAHVTLAGSLIGGDFPSGTPSDATAAGLIFGGKIGSVLIEKSIYGGSGINSGEVFSTGFIQNVTVLGDVNGGSAGSSSTLGAAGNITANALGKVVIDGSLFGGNLVAQNPNQTGNGDGAIVSSTSIGSIAIGKNLAGGTGANSGSIEALGGNIASIMIGAAGGAAGSLLGSSGASSGSISVDGSVGSLTIAHDLIGSSGFGSGSVSINGGLNALAIDGTVGLMGGSNDNTGTISVFGLLRSTNIHAGVTGSSSGAVKLTNTGYIQANSIGVMVLGGALTSGTAGSGGLDTSGAIRSTSSIGSITVGSIVGNATNPAIISAVGQANLPANATSDIAIGSITVKGPGAGTGPVTTYADILAGYNTDTTDPGSTLLGTGVNADAQIGTVKINGDIMATNIIAGVGPGATGFGTSGSAALSGTAVTDLPGIVSKISQIIITGKVVPTSNPANTFGIAAQYIVSAGYDGTPLALVRGPDNDTFTHGVSALPIPAGASDIFLYEV